MTTAPATLTLETGRTFEVSEFEVDGARPGARYFHLRGARGARYSMGSTVDDLDTFVCIAVRGVAPFTFARLVDGEFVVIR